MELRVPAMAIRLSVFLGLPFDPFHSGCLLLVHICATQLAYIAIRGTINIDTAKLIRCCGGERKSYGLGHRLVSQLCSL